MKLRDPDYRNPQAVLLIMTKAEYDEYLKHGDNIRKTLQILEIDAELQSKNDDEVIFKITPAPSDFLGKVFANLLAGNARFVTMRAEEFAQDLEDYGFKVEFS